MELYSQGYIIDFEDGTRALVPRNIRHVTVLYQEHTVGEGETLFSISNKYYRDTTLWHRIVEANDIIDPVVLTVGDTLIIPTDGENPASTVL